jgi:hypothetical protein
MRPVPLVNPLNELARSKPSDVMSRYSMSAKNFGSTHVAFAQHSSLNRRRTDPQSPLTTAFLIRMDPRMHILERRLTA